MPSSNRDHNMDTIARQKSSIIRNLQPRAAAAIYHNDSDDDESGTRVLSADYRAQHKTTMELIDFFKNAPPPAPVTPVLPPPVAVDEKKKRTLLQRLRSRKASLGGRSSTKDVTIAPAPPLPGKTSSISSASKLGEVATLPNGKKYVMIAVDYKDEDKDAGITSTASSVVGATIAGSSKRLSMSNMGEDSRSKRESRMGIQITTTFQDDTNTNGTNNQGSLVSDKRRSIIIQAGGGEGSSFSLDNTPFLLDSFALDADYVMPSKPGDQEQSPQSEQPADTLSRRETKVKFNISDQHPLDEEALSKALADRIASHKAQVAKNLSSNDSIASDLLKAPEVIMPRTTARKKVRHVQIQTQHCVMRAMHTQTESVESLARASEVKVFGTQTSTAGSSTSTAEIGTSTSKESSTSTTSTSTDSNSHSPLTSKEQEELVQLRQHNAALLAQVATLQHDLTAETRARTRAAVAMQDTREKFEMLSAMAYKKLKEMIFQRHVLEMEVRELRAQVDMQAEEKEMIYQQQQSHQQHQYQNQQGYVTVGPN
ncbi:hypothetical protein B0O80DRAFT_505122 [Mortierella sp. GBAus27b]|nr:hypothetical protein BGX31_004182 [Mortierella sp. GBA43]KAI8363050.1 hypothetical protein B0O80DRAFT_505122 [Mortierella sp. GBAus27b]